MADDTTIKNGQSSSAKATEDKEGEEAKASFAKASEAKEGQEGIAPVSGSANDTEVEKLKTQCEEYLNGWKRAKADYLNFKKEMEEKQKLFFDLANSALIVEILPIYDNLKKALSLIDNGQLLMNNDVAAWAEGIKQIKKQFEDFLKQYGIEEIKTIGEKFNHEFHEAVSKEKKEGMESDTIINELSPGYLMKGKVLVAAKVVVSE